MDRNEMKGVLEGLLFAAGEEGLSKKALAEIVETDAETTELTLKELEYDYEHDHRGIRLMYAKDVVFLSTKPQHAPYYKKMIATPQASKLSQAALETLAIIAYQQPITRVEIEELRGVKSERAVHTLVVRSMIEEVGRKEGIGRPILYGTTTDFLTYFGLTSLEELPPLPENPSEDIESEADLFFDKFKEEANGAYQTDDEEFSEY
ncbi:SMC-Scp complex subunit ScpB [Thalassobacillus hwangdonensis]|uniref:Segregation and condensation protein B n=1 Tax=Thalassobacillus hwangdonensis TaxID=546108 RepID=A0ABW3KY11_9BACI